MPSHRGFSAWIVSDGQVLKEHLVAIDANSNRVQCWIPSEAGKTFAVYWRDHGSKQDSCAYIILDGYTASGRFLWGEGVASREGIRSGADSEKPFMFTKVGNDADDGIIEGGNKEAGMITLKIKMTTRIGPRPNNAIKPVPSSPYGKKAPGSLRIGYGAERKVCPQAPVTWHVKPTKTHVTFVFRYRSREFLQAQGIMAGTPEPEPKRVRTQMRRVSSMPTSIPASTPTPTPTIPPSVETKSLTPLTPSPTPTPSPKTVKPGLDRMSSSMKKAFNPSQSSQEHLRTSHSRNHRGPRRSDPQGHHASNNWQGILTFDDPTHAQSGTESCFLPEAAPQRPTLPPLPAEIKMQMGKKVGVGRYPDMGHGLELPEAARVLARSRDVSMSSVVSEGE